MKKITACLLLLAALATLQSSQPAMGSNLLNNPGFERPDSIGDGDPVSYADWDGNVAHIAAAEKGITPYDGEGMLRFDFARYRPDAATDARSSQVWQLVDLGPYRDVVDSGIAVAQASAFFNRILGGSQTDTEFSVAIGSFLGTPNTFLWDNAMSSLLENVQSDGDVNTWEKVTTTFSIPSNADYLAIQIGARENVFNDLTGFEFHGHYADAVSMSVVPEPSALLLFGSGVLPLLAYAWGRRLRS